MGDLANILGLPQGGAYRRLYGFLPVWGAWTIGFALFAMLVWKVVSGRAPTLPSPLAARRITDWRMASGIVLFCLVVLVVFDGAGFLHGFFRQDDFSFLQVVRENERLLPQLRLYHNDHAYPLFRLEVWSLVKLAGPAADATFLAGWFNALIFLSCTGLLIGGCWTLHEARCSPLALFTLPVFLWLWPGWGEFTAGYFTLTAYVQVQAISFCATAAMLRGFHGESNAWLGLSLLLVLAAVGIDTSGLSVFATLAIVSVTVLRRGRNARWVGFACGLIAAFLVTRWFFGSVFAHPYSAREFVQNPAGKAFELSALTAGKAPMLPSALALLTGLGGIMTGYFVPPFLQLFNGRLPASLTLSLYGAQLVVVCVAGRLCWPALRRLDSRDLFVAVAFAVNALVGVALVAFARSTQAAAAPTMLWPAKYLAFSVCWLCLAAIYVGDRLCLAGAVARPRMVAGLCVAGMAGAWFCSSNWHLERALFPAPIAYVARGRFGNVENAKARAQQYRSVIGDLADLARVNCSKEIALPYPDSWNMAFFARYAVLEWVYDRTPFGVTHLFWDFPAASPGLALRGRWRPLSEIPPATREHMTKLAWLRPAFADTSIQPPADHSQIARP